MTVYVLIFVIIFCNSETTKTKLEKSVLTIKKNLNFIEFSTPDTNVNMGEPSTRSLYGHLNDAHNIVIVPNTSDHFNLF